MFDLDAYLEKIAIKEVSPSDTLINATVEKCGEVLKTKEKESKLFKQIKKAVLIAAPACALLLIGILIGSQFFAAGPAVPVQAAAACFTVDINPSVRVNVDDNNVVTSLSAQNDDAQTLIKKLDCVGMGAVDAIYKIVEQAKSDGYLNDQNKYVLVGCFGVTNEEQTLGSLQDRLEQDFGDMVTLLIVSGTLDDKSEADLLNVSPGLLKLSKMAEDVQLKDDDKVEDVVDEIKNKYTVPALSIKEKTDGLQLSWTKLNLDNIGYNGDVILSVVAADTAAEVDSLDAKVIKTLTIKPGETQTTSCKLTPDNSGIHSGVVKYYGICVKYGTLAKLTSNAVSAKMPETSQPTPKPSVSSTTPPAQTQTPQPSAEPAVSGSISGSAVVIKWRKENSENLSGYKVVASKTNPNPKYPDDGYIKYITNKDTTSVKLSDGDGGLKGGQSYYFSVTYLYNDGSAVAANAVQLTVPKKSETPTEPPSESVEPSAPPSGDYASTNIGGSMSGTTASLSWGQISDSRLDGYKVVCSFSDSSPCYPDNGYERWITDKGQTSCSLDMSKKSGYAPGATCWFAITAVYNDGTKRTGGVLALTMPADAPPPPADYPSTSLSGSMDGTTAKLNWGQIDDPRFEGYKVVMSYTNKSPSYPDDGYVHWITDRGRTSCTVDCSGGTPGASVYFTITVLYDSHNVKRNSNSVTLTIPVPVPPASDPPA